MPHYPELLCLPVPTSINNWLDFKFITVLRKSTYGFAETISLESSIAFADQTENGIFVLKLTTLYLVLQRFLSLFFSVCVLPFMLLCTLLEVLFILICGTQLKAEALSKHLMNGEKKSVQFYISLSKLSLNNKFKNQNILGLRRRHNYIQRFWC